ncbi:unnamed protein product [Ranitomeya imitator]|uniref:Uncharacterized protein n=1 Tax=Ranitomeya imitator TaxID=111125 RepID=A0ABN9M7R5_9NEOB|nr:unnamed protein product [Ranitomeya imitator]
MMSLVLSTLSFRKRELKKVDMSDRHSGILDRREATSEPESVHPAVQAREDLGATFIPRSRSTEPGIQLQEDLRPHHLLSIHWGPNSKGGHSCFLIEETDALVKAVRTTMGLVDSRPKKTVQDLMFSGLEQKKQRAFPTLYLEQGHPLQVNLDSTQTIASDVQYAFVTWRVNISLWLIKTYYPICTGYTLNHVHALHRWFTNKNAGNQIKHNHKLFNSQNDRGQRDTFSTLLGGLGTGMGVINQADICSLRTKLIDIDIATNSKKGFEVQRKINDIM